MSSARWLSGLSLGWHVLEAAIAIAAGVVAGSIALVGFGADSLVETGAGIVVLWLVAGKRLSFRQAERRAEQLIAVSFVLLAVDVTVESAGDLTGGHHPATSWVGIALSAILLVAMPPLAAVSGVSATLGSSVTLSESGQTMLCTYPSAALLVVCCGRRRRLVVGGPARGAGDRRGRLPRGSGRLTRRELRLVVGRYELAG